jgi:cysteinyl-tRNA synthetase
LNEHGHNYVRVGGLINQDICDLSETKIHHLIRERMECRKARDYDRGDRIQEELERNGVFFDDVVTLWRGDGERSFPRELAQQVFEDMRRS